MSIVAPEPNLPDEIARLETQLTAARARLNRSPTPSAPDSNPAVPPPNGLPSHPLLLLSDSALPLGSFAFSSGLESYLAHHPSSPTDPRAAAAPEAFPRFFTLALTALATTALPYLLAAHRCPERLQEWDATLDACTLCPVARRASVAQGKAVLTLWERALRAGAGDSPAASALGEFAAALKGAPLRRDGGGCKEPGGHFAPVWAAVTCAMGVTLRESAYTFLFNHAKAVVSAAVRAGVMGPYAAQGMLASGWSRGVIEGVMAENWEVGIEDAAQGVPMCDLWVGRHELLYSRIFNS